MLFLTWFFSVFRSTSEEEQIVDTSVHKEWIYRDLEKGKGWKEELDWHQKGCAKPKILSIELIKFTLQWKFVERSNPRENYSQDSYL